MELKNKVKKYIIQHNLLKDNSKVLLAVSGGPDSVALLDLMFSLRKDYGLKIIIAHFNHGIRGKASDEDQEFVKRLAQKYGVEFETANAEKKITSEEQARKARYNFLFKTAKKYKIRQIALGHNLNDQAETIIHNFIRGTGVKGLAGINPKKRYKGYTLIRPLLCLMRIEIIDYLKKNKLDYQTDLTNLKPDYTRNKIRLNIIPELEKLNPNLKKALAQKAQLYQGIDQYLTIQAKDFLLTAKVNKNTVILNQAKYLKLPQALAFEVLRKSILMLKGNLKNITLEQLNQVQRIFKQTSKEIKQKEFQVLKFSKKNGKLLITLTDDKN